MDECPLARIGQVGRSLLDMILVKMFWHQMRLSMFSSVANFGYAKLE
jgi:hypothetical protein